MLENSMEQVSQNEAGIRRGNEMATPETAFVHNAWYVIAESSEVGRTPLARTVLGLSVVLYRTEAGAVVALRNRCCHRSFPLSDGRLDGDILECGYHGLRYDAGGRCVQIPMQKSVPASVRVRAFTTIERGPFVWIWMGQEADASQFPVQSWMEDPSWDKGWSYLHVKGSYVHLHENLLDLSHLSFLHAKTFGTPEYALAPVETKIEGRDVQVWRHVQCHLPPVYGQPLGWTGEKALRSSGSQFVSPGLHVNTGIFKNLDRPEASETSRPTVKVAQLITPETTNTSHYWTLIARNFALGDEKVGEFMLQQTLTAFREDVFAIGRITDLEELEADVPFQEISLPTDKAGVTMRRMLKQLADAER
jgi:phenylpropionate dioxygenase-like ring-hydroxylating dioxygenase large terminal subunit